MELSRDSRLATEGEVLSRLPDPGTGGIQLGYYYDSMSGKAGQPIRYGGERHLLIFGPNGSGKGTRFLMPNLLAGLEDRSVVVIDPKGELAADTAKHRRTVSDVVILNPFDVLGLGSSGFNPLAWLNPHAQTFYDDAAALGEALIEPSSHDPHWGESAQGLVVGLCMFESHRHGDMASLAEVRRLLTEADEWEDYVDDDGEKQTRLKKGLRATAREMLRIESYEIESLAGRFTREHDEIHSIRSNADTQTRWLLSDKVREDISRPGGFDFRQLKDGKRPVTVYVVLPAERLRTHSAWLRLVIVSALRALYRPGGRRTLLLIDEMAALGHLGPLEDAFGIVRGYGVQIAAIFQDLPQLKHLYKDRWETFIANAGVVLGFAPNDLTTANWMSDRSGKTTILAKGISENTGQSIGGQTSVSSGSGTSEQQISRNLLLPQDFFGLDEGMAQLWLAGMAHSVRLFAPYYWKIGASRERAQPNPYYTGATS